MSDNLNNLDIDNFSNDSETESETLDSAKSCGRISHEAWKHEGPFYTIILYPDFSYKVCTCTDNFPHEPNLTRDGYSCIDWGFHNDFCVVNDFTTDEYGQRHIKFGIEIAYTDYHDYKYPKRHDILPIKKIADIFHNISNIKKRFGRLLKKNKFHREKNRNIIAEHIGFEYRKDPHKHNTFSDITDISEMLKIYGPVLITSYSCWRTMDYETCEKAINLINSTCKKLMREKYIKHLETCN